MAGRALSRKHRFGLVAGCAEKGTFHLLSELKYRRLFARAYTAHRTFQFKRAAASGRFDRTIIRESQGYPTASPCRIGCHSFSHGEQWPTGESRGAKSTQHRRYSWLNGIESKYFLSHSFFSKISPPHYTNVPNITDRTAGKCGVTFRPPTTY